MTTFPEISNKNILNTLKSRCLKFNLYLSFSQSVEITNKILNSNILDLISEDFLHYYNTPGDFIDLINFANSLNLNLKEFDLKKFLIHLIDAGYYKNNTFIKNNIYKYIELYLLKLMKKNFWFLLKQTKRNHYLKLLMEINYVFV
mgnify:CR=1 FL=1